MHVWLCLVVFMYPIRHCGICRPSDSTVLDDVGIELGTVATLALTQPDAIITRLDLIHGLYLLYPNWGMRNLYIASFHSIVLGPHPELIGEDGSGSEIIVSETDHLICVYQSLC
jgi:hypothetical protein